jgi:putative oligomerization/nucleic acid binding protein
MARSAYLPRPAIVSLSLSPASEQVAIAYQDNVRAGGKTLSSILRFGVILLIGLVATGCASSSTTLVRADGSAEQVIYRISEEKAFTIALDAYAQFLPKQSVDDVVDGRRRGYSADQRFGLDWYTHRVLVIPAVGTDASGQEVHGYWFDLSGSGSMPIHASAKHKELLRAIREALDATGTATGVTNLRDDSYETDGHAYLGLKRDARDIKLGSPPPGTWNADRLSELKTMRDRGLITDEEYQAKRRQILDRMQGRVMVRRLKTYI